MYYQCEVTFSPYVLTRGERFVLNTIVVVFLSLSVVGTASHLPELVTRAVVRLLWLCGGANNKLSVINTAIWNEMNQPRVYAR
jgi:hypothetical protein